MCGFPQTVHGGLTAALVDETFGGLSVSIWRAGKLGFRPPAYTARLEVDYKQVGLMGRASFARARVFVRACVGGGGEGTRDVLNEGGPGCCEAWVVWMQSSETPAC